MLELRLLQIWAQVSSENPLADYDTVLMGILPSLVCLASFVQ